jgi:hypothetical protein
LPVALTHNQGSETGVCATATSAYSISIGGIHDDCSSGGDFERDSQSNYATVKYADHTPYGTSYYCVPCYNESGTERFQPYAYGASNLNVGNDTITGTSFAAPQGAASAAIMQSNGLYDYTTARDIFENMSYYSICPSSAAKSGQLNDAWDAYNKTD